MATTFTKDPAALLDYSWDWAPWLAEVGDTISSATVTVTGGITTVGEPAVNGAVVTQRVSGGPLGALCAMACQITTSSGLIDERSIYLSIADR
ncbi:hypothetical protein [Streptomyces sp. NPDC059916]|uniref:phage fiber-tail adaptor protein n=1 Tax=Streptomyces sp. NPDC059916 TaxID=3347001 RepID=UPI00368AE9BF